MRGQNLIPREDAETLLPNLRTARQAQRATSHREHHWLPVLLELASEVLQPHQRDIAHVRVSCARWIIDIWVDTIQERIRSVSKKEVVVPCVRVRILKDVQELPKFLYATLLFRLHQTHVGITRVLEMEGSALKEDVRNPPLRLGEKRIVKTLIRGGNNPGLFSRIPPLSQAAMLGRGEHPCHTNPKDPSR